MTYKEKDSCWKKDWNQVISQIGDDISTGEITWGADIIEQSSIRRFLEPAEFVCGLHTNKEIAKKCGYPDVIAPYSSIISFTFPAVWVPGESQFIDESYNAQPVNPSVKPIIPQGAPEAKDFFVTDWNVEFYRPALVGERLGRKGQRLLDCIPKETKVGRGAFLSYEVEIVNQDLELIAKFSWSIFLYNQKGKNERDLLG